MIESHEQFSELERIIKALARLVWEQHGKLLIVNVPSKVEIYPEFMGREYRPQAFAQAVEPVVRKHRADWLDLQPPLRTAAQQRLAEGELLWWRDDTHWNAHGHALVAEWIAAQLVDNTGRRDAN